MNATRHDLEAVIDQTACDMTQIDPSAQFSANVLSRLAARPVWPWSRITTGLGVVATAVVVAVWLPGSTAIPIAPVAPASLVATGRPPAEQPPAPAVTRANRPRTAQTSPEEAAWLARSVTPLEVAPAITIEPIQPSRTSIAPITVEPFGPQPIELVPIDFRTTGGR